MSDFNQSNQANLPGFEEYPDMNVPDFNQMVSQKLGTISKQKTGFDPHSLMVKKKEVNSGEVIDTTPKQEWPDRDVKALEEFCKKHGIMGFNCGKMSPIAAMAILKQQLGIVDEPVDNRVPIGYEKFGVKPMIYNQKYSYTQMIKQKASQKSLLKG